MVQLRVCPVRDTADTTKSCSTTVTAPGLKGMQNGTVKTGRGISANGATATLKRQPRPKMAAASRQERGSCSSTASCPVFSRRTSDPDEEPPPRCPSSLSSPTLQGSLSSLHGSNPSLQGSLPSLHGSNPSLQGSLPSLHSSSASLQGSSSSKKGSISSLKGSLMGLKGSMPASLQASIPSLQGSASSLCQSAQSRIQGSHHSLRSSSPSLRSSSSSLRSGSSSEDDSWDTNSWSSGATCLLRSSIKQHSEEVFRARAGSGGGGGRSETAATTTTASDSEPGYQSLESCKATLLLPSSSSSSMRARAESQEVLEKVPVASRGESLQSLTSSQGTTASAVPTQIEQKIEAKLKFSQFLDEVTCRVLDPGSLQAFGAVRQREPAPVTTPCQWFNPTTEPVVRDQRRGGTCGNAARSPYQWSKCLPSCKILESSESLRRVSDCSSLMEQVGRTYLETDIDSVRCEDELGLSGSRLTSREVKTVTHAREREREHLRERERERDREKEKERETRSMLVSPEHHVRSNFEAVRCPSPSVSWSDGSVKNLKTASLPRPGSSMASDGEMQNMSSIQWHRAQSLLFGEGWKKHVLVLPPLPLLLRSWRRHMPA
ncbi:hypothetical protein AALO_G00250450 [Alosa alosa]|uniref:Uncharacterized protein n=1 Tax=Alosa alosa TaxID=278164 RepID=A0AAV6FTV3_9TELE|nr:hypothetical protein AALO_G00250450 [Alosa alosa]